MRCVKARLKHRFVSPPTETDAGDPIMFWGPERCARCGVLRFTDESYVDAVMARWFNERALQGVA